MSAAFAAIGRFLARWYSIFVLLALYELLTRFGLVPSRVVPSLALVADQLWRNLLNGDIPYHAGVTLYRAFLGFALAVVGGVFIGIAMARSRLAATVFEPIFTFAYPIPKIALYPVLIFIFGLSTGSKVALVFLECVYPIVIHVEAGINEVPRPLVWAARNMGATRFQVFAKVLAPAALPVVFTGLRIALPVALIITLVTEIIGESRGLGYFIAFSSASFQYARALAALAVTAAIGFVLDRALLIVRDRVVFWQKNYTEVR